MNEESKYEWRTEDKRWKTENGSNEDILKSNKGQIMVTRTYKNGM